MSSKFEAEVLKNLREIHFGIQALCDLMESEFGGLEVDVDEET